MQTEVFLNAKRKKPVIQLLLLMTIEKQIDKKVEVTSSSRWWSPLWGLVAGQLLKCLKDWAQF